MTLLTSTLNTPCLHIDIFFAPLLPFHCKSLPSFYCCYAFQIIQVMTNAEHGIPGRLLFTVIFLASYFNFSFNFWTSAHWADVFIWAAHSDAQNISMVVYSLFSIQLSVAWVVLSKAHILKISLLPSRSQIPCFRLNFSFSLSILLSLSLSLCLLLLWLKIV